MYGSLGTRSMVYQNEGGGLQFLPLWSASAEGPFKPQWIDEYGNFQLFDNGLFGDYIPLTGSDQVQGSIIPQVTNNISLGSPDRRYYQIYASYVTSSGVNSALILSTNLTSSNISSSKIVSTNLTSSNITSSKIISTTLTSSYITSSALTSSYISSSQLTSSYISANQITASSVSSSFYDYSGVTTGFAYFDETTHKIVGGGDLYNLPGWTIESQSINNRFNTHIHYITQSVYTGKTPSGTTNSTGMFFEGANCNNVHPKLTYLTTYNIKSNTNITALNGPGVLAIDNSTG